MHWIGGHQLVLKLGPSFRQLKQNASTASCSSGGLAPAGHEAAGGRLGYSCLMVDYTTDVLPHLRTAWPVTVARLVQERCYDASRGMSLLVEDWVSRASALQRKGRAGAPVVGIPAHASCCHRLCPSPW